MAAPAGNQFWKIRSKHGRDKIFLTPDLMRDAAFEYFQWCDDHPWYHNEAIKSGEQTGAIVKVPTSRPYTLSGLCVYIGCSDSYFRYFKSTMKESEKEFLTVIEEIETIIYTQKFEGAAVGVFNSNIIARDLGLRDKTESDVNVTGNPIQIVMPPDNG